MKAYTDIEQSKKLAEFLPIESADGFYEAQLNPTTDEWEYILFTGNEWASEEVVIPCWSLAALLEVLPDTMIGKDNKGYVVMVETMGSGLTTQALNSVDACVEMIYKLKEKDLI